MCVCFSMMPSYLRNMMYCICIGDMKQWHPLLIKSFFIILMSSTQKRITSEKKLTISFCNQRSPLHFVLSIIMTLQLLRLENNYKAYEFTRIVTKLERYMQQQRGKLLFNGIGNFCFYFLLNQNIWSECKECFFGL